MRVLNHQRWQPTSPRLYIWKPRCEARPARSCTRQTLFSLHSPCLYLFDKTQWISYLIEPIFLSLYSLSASAKCPQKISSGGVRQLPFHKSSYCIGSDSRQHKNAITFGKRRGGSRKSILGASSKLGERHNLKIFGTEGLDRPLRHGRSGWHLRTHSRC